MEKLISWSTVTVRGLISSTVHLQNADGNHRYSVGRQNIQNEDSEFHVYRMDWSESRLDFFVDDVRHGFSLTEKHALSPTLLFILNVAMGGLFTDNTIDPNFSASAMEIDYIRLYK